MLRTQHGQDAAHIYQPCREAKRDAHHKWTRAIATQKTQRPGTCLMQVPANIKPSPPSRDMFLIATGGLLTPPVLPESSPPAVLRFLPGPHIACPTLVQPIPHLMSALSTPHASAAVPLSVHLHVRLPLSPGR